ncbi:unnamed protein product [Caenorhabditis angaria]|uniref:Major facilitator superfamily (MFS) profile domain-containing protein n=1 Tax=Caenorhabditis angaria TaxID=860376 RepID=A0A9P1J0R5_9PELO|nr:unnamed protein product [Caenorhabditis angaria]
MSETSKKTNWTSLWFSNYIQFFGGVQMSIFFTSMWPYLLKLDPKAQLSFFGVVLASFSVGQAIGAPIFGWWSQKSEKFRPPITAGLLMCLIGNLIYGFLPNIKFMEPQYAMLMTRIVIGFGCGNLAALRAYVAACSTSEDRNKAVSYSFGSLVFGMLIGPALQSAFAFIGNGTTLFSCIVLDCYTSPAFFLFFMIILTIILVFYLFDDENFVGVMTSSGNSGEENNIELPNFDKLPAFLCIFLWFLMQIVVVDMESLCTVFTIAMYNWTSKEAIIYNGYIETLACGVIVVQYFLIGSTRIGKIDKRITISIGLFFFAVFYLALLPWPFYTGKLSYNPNVTDGACTYSWCQFVPRVPLAVYLFVYIICCGIAFPYVGSSIGTLFTQILGPRQQGMMQGVYAFFGSVGRCLTPLICTFLFNISGYTWISVMVLCIILIAGLGTILLWKRIVPMRIIEKNGSEFGYDNDIEIEIDDKEKEETTKF